MRRVKLKKVFCESEKGSVKSTSVKLLYYTPQ